MSERAQPLFADCTARQVRQVARAATRLDIAPGTMLVQQGRRRSQFVIVLHGTAEIVRDGRPVDEIRAGDFCGEIALVRRLPEPADVVACTALGVAVIAPREFAALYADVAPMRRRVDDAVDRRVARWIGPSAPVPRAPLPARSDVASHRRLCPAVLVGSTRCCRDFSTRSDSM